MLDRTTWQDELVRLGLTGYEARVYVALVHRDRYTAAELARASGVPRQRIYDVLSGLQARGVVRTLPGRVVSYTAVDPAASVERLMSAHREAFSSLEKATAQLVEALVPAWTSGRQEVDPLDYVEVIRDTEILKERFREIQERAETELLGTARMPLAVPDRNAPGLIAASRITATGGSVRCIYERAVIEQPDFIAEIQRFTEAGEVARVAETVPMRMCVADRTQVLMSLPDPVADGSSSTNLLIEHPALAQCLTYAFETIWASAEPLEEVLAVRFNGSRAGRAAVSPPSPRS